MLTQEQVRAVRKESRLNEMEAELLTRMPQLQAARATAVAYGSAELFRQCLAEEDTAANVLALVEYAACRLRQREIENLLLEQELPGS